MSRGTETHYITVRGGGTWLYDLDPWCPFEGLLATGLLTPIKEK